MSRNLYLGADLQEASAAAVSGDPDAIIAADTAAWANVKKTNFPERAKALADEIKQSKPLLVGLQEAALWRSGPSDSFSEVPTPASDVEFDFLAILLEKLNERGLPYIPVVCNKNAEILLSQNVQPRRAIWPTRPTISASDKLPYCRSRLYGDITLRLYRSAPTRTLSASVRSGIK